MPPSPTTWTTLLAHWAGVAQRALALPATPEGDRFRAAVPHLIALQSLALALDHMESLPAEQHHVGLDLASVQIREHAAALRTLHPDALPPPIQSALHDAKAALDAAKGLGMAWTVATDALTVEHPAQVVAALIAGGFSGDLLLPTPGGTLFRSSPCAFIRENDQAPIDDGALALVGYYLGQGERLVKGPARARPKQVHRQFDFAKGGPVRDLVARFDAPGVAGQPQLLWAIRGGEAQPVPLPARHQAPTRTVPVVFDE